MTASRHAGPSSRSRPALLVTAVVALVGVVAWAASVVVSDAWGRSQIDLAESFTGRVVDPDWPYLNAVDRTAAVCGQVGCVQAVGNQYLTLLKFGSVDDARRYASALGPDGVQIDPLVVHFDGAPLNPGARQEIVDTVSGINVSSPD